MSVPAIVPYPASAPFFVFAPGPTLDFDLTSVLASVPAAVTNSTPALAPGSFFVRVPAPPFFP